MLSATWEKVLHINQLTELVPERVLWLFCLQTLPLFVRFVYRFLYMDHLCDVSTQRPDQSLPLQLDQVTYERLQRFVHDVLLTHLAILKANAHLSALNFHQLLL